MGSQQFIVYRNILLLLTTVSFKSIKQSKAHQGFFKEMLFQWKYSSTWVKHTKNERNETVSIQKTANSHITRAPAYHTLGLKLYFICLQLEKPRMQNSYRRPHCMFPVKILIQILVTKLILHRNPCPFPSVFHCFGNYEVLIPLETLRIKTH